MGAVTVLVLHPPLPAEAGPLAAALDAARRVLAARHLAAFRAAGADEVVLVEEHAAEPFGARLRRLAAALATPGLVVLGSGSLALAGPADCRALVAAAAADAPGVLANNRYSADAVAISRAELLRELPDLPADNALPRWLEEVAGLPVADLRARWWLAFDLDSPADAVLAGGDLPEGVAGSALAAGSPPAAGSPLAARLAEVRSILADRRAEVTVAGRTSARTLAALERRAACRVRALVEERGLRASSRLALAGDPDDVPNRPDASAPARRPRVERTPVSVLGLLLEREGPGALGAILARLGDAAVVDSRVLLAHRLGPDETGWPPAEDRFASDLLVPERVGDPWLRELTVAARAAPIPLLLGGHTLVGPGVRLLAGDVPRRTRRPPGGTR